MTVCLTALLLAFALLTVRQGAHWVVIGQSACVAVAAGLSHDPAALPLVGATAGIAALAWRDLTARQPAMPFAAIPAGVLAVTLALVATPTEAGALAIATVLLGVLTAGTRPALGAACICQGGLLALTLSDAPLRGASGVALAALAALAITGAEPWRRA